MNSPNEHGSNPYPPKYIKMLTEEIGPGIEFIESRTSSVTTSWGVNWDEVLIARDIMQNFFDANRDALSNVKVQVEGSKVTISAPATFDLERLFYLGSEKGDGDIGQYGEGFKVAVMCLLRDHRVEPIAMTADKVVYMRISDRRVADTQLYPVVYDFFRTRQSYSGSCLILRGCSQRLIKAMEKGLTHFFFEENPLLNQRIWTSRDRLFAIFSSHINSGYVFYRNLNRGEIPDIPIILVINKEYAAIEKLIKHDRDRIAFGEALMKTFYNIFSRNALRHNQSGQRAVVEAGHDCWIRGHPLLSEIAEAMRYDTTWIKNDSIEVFGDNYFARGTSSNPAEQMQYSKIEKSWQEEGRIALPGYFKKFGVINAPKQLEDLKNKALQDAKNKHHRVLSPAEIKSLSILKTVLRELDPCLISILEARKTNYTVADTETLLGELKRERNYHSTDVFFSSDLFISDFALALATYLHEHSHIFGYDGSRAFTDALTELVEAVVRNRNSMDQYEAKWEQARKNVEQERVKNGENASEKSVEELIAPLTSEELKAVMLKIPLVLIKRILNEKK